MPHLVLSRREGEFLDIVTDQGIVSVRVERSEGPVKLGIFAPSQIKIVRRELSNRDRESSQNQETRSTSK